MSDLACLKYGQRFTVAIPVGYDGHMAYAIDISAILAKTLQRFSTLNPHQLAGHVANLDFWLAEVQHATRLIDQYRIRFEAMKSAQMDEANKRGTEEWSLAYDDVISSRAAPPKRVPDTELHAARRELIDSAYRFLLRCHKSGMLDEAAFRAAVQSAGTSVDPADLAK
jgi:hypothetical protein